MFDIGWSELLVIGVVAVVVVGPKDLPRLMRTFGHYAGKLRHMAGDFQRQFEEAVRETEIDEVRKAMQDFHAEMSDATRPPVDKPLMMPSASKTPGATSPPEVAAAAPKPKVRGKKAKSDPDDKAAAKPKRASPKPRKPHKPKEQTP